MSCELTLRQTPASGLLLPAKLDQALALVAKLSPSAPRGAMHGQELRLGRSLSLDDGACAGFVLDFGAQGARVVASAHGPSASLLAWAIHSLAGVTKCELVEDGTAVGPEPESHRAAAFAYLEAYEADVLATRKEQAELDGQAFVAWLAREEHVALAPEPGPGSFDELPTDDATRLYEVLLESDGIEDLFISERELARLLTRFRARFTTR